ncbi:MAG: Uroporphyrinogen III synthase [Candidatus Tokpelaia hoelldobleri]|uniref:Uroporphyrinogen III synthase n=1 Tax=Candidatus Tokpelaia hoelldobleri TaxID=1902579 RepID=A0A1U9JWQ2_9HYPH|nr:MAG: Uroporphyrinogen III synthase [Candidatus Tokpelaia hoelldoblerii]
MTKPSVLIIRPQQAAKRTAGLLAARGFVPHILPLSIIVPLTPAIPHQPYDGVIATSAAAFAAPLAEDGAWLKTLPFHCVGSRTREAAHDSGFTAIGHCALTARQLAGELCQQTNKYFLYLAGQTRRHELENSLRAAGIRVDIIERYATHFTPPTATQLAAVPRPPGFILLYSAKSARFLPGFAAHIGANTRILCLSSRIAAAVPAQWRDKIQVAAAPVEQKLLALLPF